jgi:NAD(P)-dependent dehydrogenase (short-subunit alcohol dehydrogenase family)
MPMKLMCPRTDVTQMESLEETFDSIIQDFGHIDNW